MVYGRLVLLLVGFRWFSGAINSLGLLAQSVSALSATMPKSIVSPWTDWASLFAVCHLCAPGWRMRLMQLRIGIRHARRRKMVEDVFGSAQTAEPSVPDT